MLIYTFRFIPLSEWQEVVNQYLQLEADALRQYNSLPACLLYTSDAADE